ncbi:hypothetical protein FIBSPDRAFT_849762 [Athelia psychrophila]|uniref:RlpA-like protein double-psi beta-barrel domain-containing protein n=1 Tax=Athelia psychrophila TaxID=1759441 RepID=A0A166U334_9AGAM|nr:hypothetical protein FIBSPDRAFT_849762 [Fibularhizoctonia sp. CBS 109695]
MKLLIFLLALPAYLALFSITTHARAVNTTSSADPSTRLAPTGSLHHRRGHVHMHARFRVRHRQAFTYEGALSGDTSGATLAVKGFEGLRKRELSRLTFFTPGLGACGGRNTNEDFIVALSAQDWDGGSHCNDKITIMYNGRSVHAKIVDKCMSCPAGGLDLSEGLFSFLADPGTGIIYGQWMYGAGETTMHTHT